MCEKRIGAVRFRLETRNGEGQVRYCNTLSFICGLVNKQTEPKKRQTSCGFEESLLQELPPPSFCPHFLPLTTRPQQRRKHVFSQAASNWYRWALGTQCVVLVLCKMHAKHNSLQYATLWDTTGYLQPDDQSGPGSRIVSFMQVKKKQQYPLHLAVTLARPFIK